VLKTKLSEAGVELPETSDTVVEPGPGGNQVDNPLLGALQKEFAEESSEKKTQPTEAGEGNESDEDYDSEEEEEQPAAAGGISGMLSSWFTGGD